ncbi:MAG: restriction endonuclease subunit S [Acidimicrobiaceae bacterium]|nr:restriction endonuclease subunit S [Acidimicrobiaceae bacterium]
MTLSLDLPERYRQQLLALLEAYVPEAEAWAYGSRVQGTHHDASDLDVVLRGPNLAELGAEFLELVEAVRESTIPILVDVFDWARLPESFHREIEREYVVLKEARTWREPETVDAFGRSASIDLDPSHRRVVMRLLRGFVPSCEVRAYGPRAEWTAEQHSRLDIAVLGADNVNPYALSDLQAAFQRSDLPFGVNVADWDAASTELRQQVQQQYLVLQPSASPDGWLTVTLGECGYLVRDSVDPTELDGLPYIGLEHIGESTLRLTGVGQASDVTSTKSRFNAGDVLFGKLRPYFRKVVQPRFEGICSTDIWVLRPQEGVSPDYLFYLMASPEVVEQAVASSKGTRMPRADWKFVANQLVVLGPLAEQHRIASVLRALDDRIELNRRMCETLEEMAQALFKSWFVDFEPVRAKMGGGWQEGESLPGLPAHLYGLFPDRLVDSELGPIPAGWRTGKYADLVSEISQTQSAAEILKETPVVGLEHLPRRSTTLRDWEVGAAVGSRRKAFEAGDILFAKLRPYFHKVVDAPFSGCVSTDALVFRPHSAGLRARALAVASSIEFVRLATATSNGTRMPRADTEALMSYRVLHPTSSVERAFGEIVDPMNTIRKTRAKQSHGLSEERDVLLSKLISGEVRLPEFSEAVGG